MMSKSKRKNTTLSQSSSDEEGENYYERQALIDDQELCDDEIDLISTSHHDIRQRQASSKNKLISKWDRDNINGIHELKNLNSVSKGGNKIRDLISEPVVEFTYYEIQQGDSLQSICLRFACQVNQVKRWNGLMTDQDFYALRRIKLPRGKFGLLEEYLKTQTTGDDLLIDKQNDSHRVRPRSSVNSPGSALSVSTRPLSHFKPLLSPGFSNGILSHEQECNPSPTEGNLKTQHSHSHSFSSLREFQGKDGINVDIERHQTQHMLDQKLLKEKSFIKPELEDVSKDAQSHIDDLLTIDEISIGTEKVDRVFQDLDYHVELAKAAAETYDQRAIELVYQLENANNPTSKENYSHIRVSKIPELFFCSENFGLNYRNLIVFIFVVCLIVPLVYINQTTPVTT